MSSVHLQVAPIAMLDEHDNLLARASNRGQRGGDQYEDSACGEAKSKHLRSRSGSPESKRHKVDETLYTWKVCEEISPLALSVNLEQTRAMV